MRTFLLGCLLLTLVGAAFADPPPWAPAHGKRAKDGDRVYYVGYSGREWQRDYGVLNGRCNTDEILTAVGAVAGGVIGNRTASPENRTVATIAGALIGGVIGNRVGDAIDDRDRACVGHSLELAGDRKSVTWTNSRTGMNYVVVPLRDVDASCRDFELRVAKGRGKAEKRRLRACRGNTPGDWTIVNDRR